MSSGLANAQQQPQTSISALSFPGLSSNFAAAAGLSAQAPQSVMDMQQLMLASLDPNFGSNPLRAYYLSQLAALSNTGTQSSDQSLPSSSSAASSSATSSSGTTTTAALAASGSPPSDLSSQASQAAEAQAALNAISLASLSSGNTSDPSPTPGTTTSQVGESSVPSAGAASASGDLPNWLSSFFPGMSGSASASNVLQASANSLTAATSGISNLFEQMQLLNAAQMMSSGLGAAVSGASLSGPPLNALAAALNQQPSVSVTAAPPLTPNGNAATLFSTNANYNSPSKESYCDLCDKTFCNRYFLKTHRQKKHGIVGEAQSPVKSFPSSPSALSNIPLSQTVSSLSTSTSTTNTLSTMPFSANLNALMAAAAASSTTQVPATTSSAAQPPSVIVNGGTGKAASREEPSSPPEKIAKIDSQENDCVKEKEDESCDDGEKSNQKQQNSREPETSTTDEFACNLCSRSFSSLFALVSHKTQDHPPLGSNAAANQGASQPQSSPMKSSSPSPASDGKVSCELCDKEFESRQYLQQHILLQHCNVTGNAASLSNSLLLGGLPLPFMLSSALPQNFQVPDVSQSNLLTAAAAGINGQFNQPKQGVKRQYSSTEKNYCDLCNKNLCNKYFLRTHMFKMHKIVIDENKTVIANVDTLEEEKSGAVSFRCDVCGTDVKTRHELRSHKQDAHGVIPIQTPPAGQNRTPKHSASSTPSLASVPNHAPTNGGQLLDKLNAVENKTVEQCSWCDCKCKNMAQLQEHIQEKHGCQLPQEVVENFRRSLTERMNLLAANQQSDSITNSRQNCSFCTESFPDEFQLQTHTINKHTAEMCLQNSSSISDEKSVGETGDSDNNELLKCPQPQCNFRSLNVESLQLHLERHTPLDSALLKMRDQATAALAFLQQKSASDINAKITEVDEDEEDEAMEATTAVALQMAKANEHLKEKPYPCPISSCQRRYHDSGALEKHIAKVHQWQYKVSPKKQCNGIIARSKLTKLTKRYSCQFPKCQMRFLTRQLCREHVQTHFKHGSSQMNDEQSTDNPQTSAFDEGMDSYVREEESLAKDLHEQLPDSDTQKEHEQHSHTSGSMSPTSENMPEGFARSMDAGGNQKPYLMQSFIMRKYCSEDGQPELLQEVLLHLPVRAPVDRRLKTTIELIPASEADAPLKRI